MEGMLSSLLLLCLLLTGADAIAVTIPQPSYEVARGDNITVPCSFPAGTPKVVLIQWSNLGDQTTDDEIYVITYYIGTGDTDVATEYTGRASLDMNIASGKFNLQLSGVTLFDNRVFKCHVQVQGDTGKSYAITRVLVLVPPSPPECNLQGKAEYGQNINISCRSREGSPTPTYTWTGRDVQNNVRPFDPKTSTINGGILSLYNISKDTSGFYICTSTNKIRSASYNFTLSVMPPSMNIGSTAGIIVGVALFLLVLAIIIYCCCCRKKNKEEEYAMGVHEDEYHDKDPAKNGEVRKVEGPEEVRKSENTYVKSAPDRDEYEEQSERGNDRRRDYDDRRSDYDDRRSDYDDRRSDYSDRRSDYSDRRDKYSDRHERYDDDRHYNDRRDRRYDDDRYDEPYDDRNRDRPPATSNKPPRRN